MVILGDMLELGNESLTEHKNILNFCIEQDLPFLTVGSIFKEINLNGFRTISELENYFTENKVENKSILLKGSRGISLEKLITNL